MPAILTCYTIPPLGDVSLSAEDRRTSSPPRPPHRTLEPPPTSSLPHLPGAPEPPSPSHALSELPTSDQSLLVDHAPPSDADIEEQDADEEEEVDEPLFGGGVAVKFLLAGGVAGVISRTATAPFDRLKVYLITAAPEQLTGQQIAANAANALKNGNAAAGVAAVANGAQHSSLVVMRAVQSLYRGGGVRAFWVGNGLNVTKILPVRWQASLRTRFITPRANILSLLFPRNLRSSSCHTRLQ